MILVLVAIFLNLIVVVYTATVISKAVAYTLFNHAFFLNQTTLAEICENIKFLPLFSYLFSAFLEKVVSIKFGAELIGSQLKTTFFQRTQTVNFVNVVLDGCYAN
jgi:hypothetical protein